MSIEYTQIFHPKDFQNIPKLAFWYENVPAGNPGGRLAFLYLLFVAGLELSTLGFVA
jgi:hypothetical protein